MKQFPDVDFPAGEAGGQFVALVDECGNGEKPQVSFLMEILSKS